MGKVIEREYRIRRERKRKEDKTQTFYNQTRSLTPSCPVLKFPAGPNTYNKRGGRGRNVPILRETKMRREEGKKEKKGKETIDKENPKEIRPCDR